jgi:hypothetical protein
MNMTSGNKNMITKNYITQNIRNMVKVKLSLCLTN